MRVYTFSIIYFSSTLYISTKRKVQYAPQVFGVPFAVLFQQIQSLFPIIVYLKLHGIVIRRKNIDVLYCHPVSRPWAVVGVVKDGVVHAAGVTLAHFGIDDLIVALTNCTADTSFVTAQASLAPCTDAAPLSGGGEP